MEDENTFKASNTASRVWKDVPTIFVDGVLAFATGGGVFRITFAELAYNSAADATEPAFKSVVNLAIPAAALPQIIGELQRVLAETENASRAALP